MTPQDFEKLEAAIKMQSFAKFFSDEDYEQFKKVFKERGFKKGQKILWRGQKGFFFFIIGKGKISVRVTGEDKKEKIVAHLKPGDFVGEISLLYNRPRVADCYAEEDDTLLFLLASRPFFDVFVAKQEVREALEEIAQNRMAQTKKISTDDSEQGEKPESPASMVPDIPALEPIEPEEIKLPQPKTKVEKKKAGPEAGAALTPLAHEPEEARAAQHDPAAGIEPISAEPSPHTAAEVPPAAGAAEPGPSELFAVEESILMPEEGILFPDVDPILSETGHPASETAASDDIEALQSLFCFADRDIITQIKALFREKGIKSGEMLEVEGSKSFVLVNRGEMCVKDTARNLEMPLPRGSYFGELSLVFPLETRFEYKAAADSTILIMDTEESLKALMELPGVREELEVKAIRRICGDPFLRLSSEPAVEKHLASLFKHYSVAFHAQ